VDSNGLERAKASDTLVPFVILGDDGSEGVLLGVWLLSRGSRSNLGSYSGGELCICALEDAERVLGFGRVDVEGSGAVFKWGLEYGVNELGGTYSL